jgi:hypothetical protein
MFDTEISIVEYGKHIHTTIENKTFIPDLLAVEIDKYVDMLDDYALSCTNKILRRKIYRLVHLSELLGMEIERYDSEYQNKIDMKTLNEFDDILGWVSIYFISLFDLKLNTNK